MDSRAVALAVAPVGVRAWARVGQEMGTAEAVPAAAMGLGAPVVAVRAAAAAVVMVAMAAVAAATAVEAEARPHGSGYAEGSAPPTVLCR